ncbi:T9SS type A sorting domain-containing protein [Hanstruepera ponticola]|uniref:T9SS type A sorting domain-containing protein n=1 Tax=Hanstruepera ponticola TaxID=2042995 RepID=UPI0017841868|nr:T9SS type A sorting domain-containing protein [Hanstruepera ponticola]
MKKFTFSILFGLISLCGFSQIGLTENFDSGLVLPTGWTSDSGDYFGAVVQVCQTLSPRANLFDGNTTAHLTSPNIVGASNASELTVTFDYKIVDWSAATDATPPGWGEIRIQYSTNNGGNWTTIETINDDNHITSNECFNFSTTVDGADLPTGSDFKLRIDATWLEGTYYIYIDNVTATQVVVDPPSCVNLITPANGANGVGINTNLEWSAASGIPTGYTLTVGTTPGGTDVVDNQDVGLSTSFNFAAPLEYSTTYYVTVLGYNANGPAEGCEEFSFTTGADPNAPVDCAAGTPINTVFCYDNNETMTWNFQSSDGGPMNVFFNAGQMEGCCDEVTIYDGTDNTGVVLYDDNNGGDMTGVSVNSTTGFIFIEIDSDGSVSCASNGYTPLNFDVSCIDTTAVPNCNSVLTTPANGSVDVNENTDITWSSASIIVTGYTISIGTTPGGTDILDSFDNGPATTYDPGTLDYETTYYVTIVPYNDNGPAINCNEQSFTTRDDPNQIVDCSTGEVVNTTYCYGPNDTMVFNYASSDGSPLSVVFNAGQVENNWDELIVTDSDGTELYNGYGNAGNLAGLVFVSSGSTIAVAINSDGVGSCTTSGYTQWDIDVSCVDTTALPNCNASLTGEVEDGTTDVSENEDLTWSAASVFVTGYIINMGTTPGGTDVLDGVDVGNVLTYDPGTLAYETTYYVTIIPYNDNGNATDCTEESFTTRPDPNQIVDCESGQIVNTTHCYENGTNNLYVELYSFQSSNGNPLNMFFHSGTIETCCDTIRIEEGDGTVIYQGTGTAGNLAGLSLNSTTDRIVMFVEADGSVSCSSGSRIEWDFDVSCIDVSAVPNCNAALTGEVADGSIDVDEDEDLNWSPASIIVTGYVINMGTTPGGTDVLNGVDVGNVLTYDPGTLDYDTTYYVTIIPYNDNGNATDCTEESFTVRSDPFQIVDCDAGQVVNTTHCYENGTNNVYVELYSFQSSSGFPLNILFNSGTIETCCDTLRIEEGDGTVLYQGTGNGGDLTGLAFTSTSDTIIVFAEADGSVSCSSGSREIWDFDVWCQTCVPQTVSFDVVNGDCITDPNNPVFEVSVDVTDMGSAESITISDNQGGAPQVLNGVGTVTFGPFAANTNVIITAANTDDPNCIIESNPLSFLCPPPPNPCSIAYAGEDTAVDCENPDAELTANFHLYGQDTENYDINAIDTCPTPPVDGATPTSVETDDVWSEVIDLGFEFCFYGGTYDQIIVGSNGVLSFETEFANTGNGWAFDPEDTLPNNDNPSITEGNIFGVGHDIDPSVCGSIDYVVLGSSPYRQFVVNYNAVCHFGSQCNSNTSTTQIVLHESSNNIDIHILSKPTCTAWNDGLAVVGLQSVDDTQGVSPPGRNMGVWTVDEPESWRFSPSGTPNYTLQWLDDEGTVVGTEDTVTVSPTETTTYTFAVTYDLCTGGQATVTDDVVVSHTGGGGGDASFTMEATCDGGTATITGDEGGTFAFNPEPDDEAEIDESTGTITGGTPGETYTVEYTLGDENCPSVSTQDVTVLDAEDASFTMDSTCNGVTTTITGDTGGTFSFNPEPGDEAEIDAETGEITNGTPDATYTVQYTTAGDCPASSTQDVTLLSAEDASFTLEATCDGAIATITGDAGGTFSFNPEPGDGAQIDSDGTITNGTPGATYTVEYTTAGECASSSSQDVTVLSAEDASFTLEATCDGAIATITGDAGGTFSFNPEPGDGAQIDSNGTITNGTPGTTYTVEYTTTGECPATSTQDVTVLDAEDASFALEATCDGATATVTGDAGGTFAFNPEPGDGAQIDSNGNITNGTPGATYTVEYTTSGPCPASSTQTVTVLPAEDASFTLDSTCTEATATITGNIGGTFAFNPEPGDGAEINETTGTITNGTLGNTYTVEYTTSGPCPASSTETITLEDNVPPVAIAQDITIELDSSGNATITAEDINNGSSDDCGIASISIDIDTFNCDNVGDNTVTLTVVDVAGNVSTATATVTVEDNTMPDVVCNNITVSLDSSGSYTLSAADLDAISLGSSDACGIASMSVSTENFSCEEIGDNTVTLTVVDVNGNENSCEATVTVEGVIPELSITEEPLSVFCQGVILTAESDVPVTYEWSTGEDTQSITVTENGTYGVTVTSETGCTTYAEYLVTSIIEGTPLSDYTIFASNEVFLHGNNAVQSGGVGVGSANGEIKLHQDSHIEDFGQATSFTLNQGSTIGEEINNPANPIMPDFIYNTLSSNNSETVRISNGDTQTLDGEVYDEVWVRAGATVIFSQPNVFINRLKTSEGATVEFEGCSNVYLNSMFMLAKYGTINSNGNAITFYVNNDVHIEKGSDVNAVIYSTGQILAKGSNVNSNNPEPTYMTGLFIANKVHGLNNVIWNAADICDPCPVYDDVSPQNRESQFDAVAWPNPSNTTFDMRIISPDVNNDAVVYVYDMSNKLVHTATFRPDQKHTFGSDLDGGVYIVKVKQAKNSKVIRLIKY